MVDDTNDRLRHQQTTAASGPFPQASPGGYSGNAVVIIPLGLLGLFGLLVTIMLMFQP